MSLPQNVAPRHFHQAMHIPMLQSFLPQSRILRQMDRTLKQVGLFADTSVEYVVSKIQKHHYLMIAQKRHQVMLQ
jgi:hypothetical protein